MTLIICIDERGGMSFLGKCQSRDAAVYRDISDTVGKGRLLLTENYGFKLIQSTEFAGRSHDKITKEIYTK